ncbi:hypothetical protein LCGC14_0169990 [marine sediment metagenome]|uniref:Uncharacterized protein n=1 Tax=marine sediment metagenome TaxID=412755 RepID=A0A0F9USI5_9ZZZZ
MLENIHFYDSAWIGRPADGQPTRFESLMYKSGVGECTTHSIKLRADVAFDPLLVEDSASFSSDLSAGASEYEFARELERLFSTSNTLHIGLGITSEQADVLNHCRYRCLSTLPHCTPPANTFQLDLITVLRAINLLRPPGDELLVDPFAATSVIHSQLLARFPSVLAVDSIKQVMGHIQAHAPKLLKHSLGHTCVNQIQKSFGLESGQIDSLGSVNPLLIVHESIGPRTFVCGFPIGVDPQDPHLVYMVDLQADLSDLAEDGSENVQRFVRQDPNDRTKPISTLDLTRIPFVCPLSAVDVQTAERLDIDKSVINHNVQLMRYQSELCLAMMDYSEAGRSTKADPDYQLRSGDYSPQDLHLLEQLHKTEFSEWPALLDRASDSRIKTLAWRLSCRAGASAPKSQAGERWAAHCASRLKAGLSVEQLSRRVQFCKRVLEGPESASPLGVRTAALHWLSIMEVSNDIKSVV